MTYEPIHTIDAYHEVEDVQATIWGRNDSVVYQLLQTAHKNEGVLIGARAPDGLLVGFVFGPLAYWAGARLGALTLGTPEAVAIAATGLVWALALPVLIRLYVRLSSFKQT